jgi:ABC-type cobalamin/Fe3+-siderophores transport system ATPase subunit
MSELLELSDVSKRYRRGSQQLNVLREISLTVSAGEVLGLIGVRRQGKTTLLRIAAGIEAADTGSVYFEGQQLASLSDRDLARLLGGRIAWAGRTGPAMRMRIVDYVAMPLLVRRGLRHRRARRNVYVQACDALERVGAADCADQYWEDLSDWERALVEIAQAIAGGPSLLLTDDLTDALGVRETDEITALLRSLARESSLGVLMTASDAQATLWSDQIMVLAGGRLTQGPRSAGGNVIEFPDLGLQRRDVQRGGIS